MTLANEGEGLALSSDETKPSEPKSMISGGHASRRLFARVLDVYFYFLAIQVIIGLTLALSLLFFRIFGVFSREDIIAFTGRWRAGGISSFEGILLTIVFGFLSIFLAAALTGCTGRSLGKWFFGIAITDKNGDLLGYWRALRREAYVYIVGLGACIPALSGLTVLLSLIRVSKKGITYWDEKVGCCVHYREGRGQLVRNVFGFLIMIFLVCFNII